MKNLSFIFLILISQFVYSQSIDGQIGDIEEKIISWRHDFHKFPEVSNREFKTSEKIARHLESLGIEVTRNVGVNGVVGILEGKSKGKVVALRADMDALPITENNGLPYQSVNDGVMHACGHDGHMSILMATAEILSKNNNFTVKSVENISTESLMNTVNKIVNFGWKKEAVPVINPKKSLIARFFSALFD